MTEPLTGPSGPGSVVLDLGADIGALVLFTPADMDGREIEISRDGDPRGPTGSRGPMGPGAGRTHSQVRQRHVATVTRYAAVYPGLRAGQYTIWSDERRPAATAVITGGQITSCRWPES